MILGTHSLAPEIADLAADAGREVAAFAENLDPDRCKEELHGLPVLWIDDLSGFASTHEAVCGLGTTRRSLFVDQVAKLGMDFATIIHPTARVSTKSHIGEGSIVSAGAVIAAYSVIGRHVLINRGVLIGHDTRVGDYASIQPGANVAGLCSIGEATWVGIGAVVSDRVNVGANSVVGAGAVVITDVPDNVTVVGVPARVVKKGIEGR